MKNKINHRNLIGKKERASAHAVLFCLGVFIAGIFLFLNWLENRPNKMDERNQISQSEVQRQPEPKQLNYHGKTYIQRDELQTFLFI